VISTMTVQYDGKSHHQDHFYCTAVSASHCECRCRK
jgi:hypothetical protein